MMLLVKEVAYNWIEQNKKRIIEISNKAWEYAEVGLKEEKTSKLLADYIEKQGFKVEKGIADMPTAFVASWTNGEKGPTVGILGELDALAGLSQKAVPYKEPVKEGAPGHGCGHNIHGTGGMVGAVALKKAMEEGKIEGTIKFFGCPAEETLVGKIWLTRHGYFNGVDVVISHHPGQANTAGTGSNVALNSFKLHFYGRTAHAGGAPENGISALDAVELTSVGVNYMREHIMDKARIHSIIEFGGGQPNVVPEYSRVWYYVRAPEREQVDNIYNWVLQIADGADKMARTTHKIEFLTGCYNTIPNKILSDQIVINMKEIKPPTYEEAEIKFAEELNKSIDQRLKKEGLRKSERPGWEKLVDKYFDERVLDDYQAGKIGTGSSDVADVSWNTPTKEFGTVCAILGTPGHSWQLTAQSGMSIGHKGLIFASKVIASTCIDILTKPKLLKSIKTEFKDRLQGRKYKPPIPLNLKPPLNQF
jgi:aminobenzoyl-glutamate utilization protein B